MLSEPSRAHPSLSGPSARLRRLRTVALCWLTATAGGFLICRLLPPTYGTAARVQLTGVPTLPSEADSPLPAASAPAPELQAEVQRLRSPAFIRAAGQALGAHLPPAYLTFAVDPAGTIEVRAESGRPEAAAAWANTAAQLAVGQAGAQRREFLDGERAARRTAAEAAWSDVRRIAGELARLRQQMHQNGQDQALDQRLRQQVQLAAKERSARGALASLDAKLAVVRGKLARTPRTVMAPVSRPNPEWQSLNAQLGTVRADRSRLLESTPEGSPEIQRLDARIRDLQARLAAKKPLLQERREQPNPTWQALTARVKELEAHRAAEARLAEELTGASRRMQALVEQLAPWQEQARRLTRELAQARARHASLAHRLRAFQLWERRLPPAASVTMAAIPPTAPMRRNQLPQLGLAMLAGLCCGLVLAFRPEPARPVRDRQEAMRVSGWPVLGVLPAAGAENPESTELREQYRALGASLRFASVTHPVRTLLVISPEPCADYGEVCAGLAGSLTRGGMRVVLVDADTRRPELHRRYGVPLEPGLTSVLAGRTELVDAMAGTAHPGLQLLPAGSATTHLPAALQSEPLTRLLAGLREHADLVLVEAPPDLHPELLQAAVRGVDGVVAVVPLGRTTRAALQALRDRLLSAGAPVLGLVLMDSSKAASDAPAERFQGVRVPDDLRYPPPPGPGAPARVVQAPESTASIGAAHTERAGDLP